MSQSQNQKANPPTTSVTENAGSEGYRTNDTTAIRVTKSVRLALKQYCVKRNLKMLGVTDCAIMEYVMKHDG